MKTNKKIYYLKENEFALTIIRSRILAKFGTFTNTKYFFAILAISSYYRSFGINISSDCSDWDYSEFLSGRGSQWRI